MTGAGAGSDGPWNRPAADSKTGVNEKDGHNLRTQHGSGNLGTTVTLRRGRGNYFLLTWGTL
jgi:hypothetical protein